MKKLIALLTMITGLSLAGTGVLTFDWINADTAETASVATNSTYAVILNDSQDSTIFETLENGTGTVWQIVTTTNVSYECVAVDPLVDPQALLGEIWTFEDTNPSITTYTNNTDTYGDLLFGPAAPDWLLDIASSGVSSQAGTVVNLVLDQAGNDISMTRSEVVTVATNAISTDATNADLQTHIDYATAAINLKIDNLNGTGTNLTVVTQLDVEGGATIDDSLTVDGDTLVVDSTLDRVRVEGSLRVNTTNFVVIGENVGINTASPTEALHVEGNGLFAGRVYIGGGSSRYLSNVGGALAIYSTANVGGYSQFRFSSGTNIDGKFIFTGTTSSGVLYWMEDEDYFQFEDDVVMDETLTVTETLTASNIVVSATHTPASATDTGTTGQIAWDADYIYICISTDVWKRSAISTWP